MLEAAVLKSRIIAARAHDWRRQDDGSWFRGFHDGRRMKAVQTAGLWRLICTENGVAAPEWESDDVQECFEMAAAIDRSQQSEAAWTARTMPPKAVDIGGGLAVSIEKASGSRMAHALVSDRDGKRVGNFLFARTNWPADFVLGQPTVNGSVWLSEEIRRLGVCRRLYDLVEAASGMPVVPHGRNLVPGALTEMSERFWQKRTAERPVVGNDTSSEARRCRVTQARALLEIEARFRLAPEFAVAAAEAMSWTVRGVAHVPEGEDTAAAIPSDAWCVTADGENFSAEGFFDPAPLLRAAEISPDHRVIDYDASMLKPVLERSLTSGFFHRDCSGAAEGAKIVLARHGLAAPRTAPAPVSP